MMVTLGYIILSCAVMGFVAVEGRSTGAPPQACALIQPQHPSSPQTSPVPFSVDLSAFTGNAYTPGETYIITLRGGATNPNFIGFMIQAWLVADNSAVGTFAASGTNYQAQCNGDTAATHTNANEKTLVTLSWTAPPAGTGAISFRFAFVDDYLIFWDDIMTEAVAEAQAVAINPSASSAVIMVTGTTPTPMDTPTTAVSIPPSEMLMATAIAAPPSMPSTATVSPSPTNIVNNTGESGSGSTGIMASTVLTILLTVILMIINS